MENRDNSSVLRGKEIVYGEIADWLCSANNYEAFTDSLNLCLLRNDRARGLLQIYMEYKFPSLYADRRKEDVGNYISDVVIDSLSKEVRADKELVHAISEESKAVALAWHKNPFLFEDCAAASPEQIETYVGLIDRKFNKYDYEYPHLVVGYKKLLQNQRHDKYFAGETDILSSKKFVESTGEKPNTPNWDMEQYAGLGDEEFGQLF